MYQPAGTEIVKETQDQLNTEESMEVENGRQKEEMEQDQKEGSIENGDGNKKDTDEKDKDKMAEGEGEGEDESSDPYAYTRRDEFTSENFKIEVRGLPRYYPVGVSKSL